MTAATTSAAPRADREEFLALVCADEDLLRAEFEAIMEANWDRPEPPRPTWPTPPERTSRSRPAIPPTTPAESVRVERRPAWRRERAPPAGRYQGLPCEIESRKDGDAGK